MKHLAIKVTNKYESEAVQKALFDMGFEWSINVLGNTLKRVIDATCIGSIINGGVDSCTKRLISARESEPNLYLVISSSDFFSTYAGHIERFPDYVDEENKPEETPIYCMLCKSIISHDNIFCDQCGEKIKKWYTSSHECSIYEEKKEPKFKVGNYLYYTLCGEIRKLLITDIFIDFTGDYFCSCSNYDHMKFYIPSIDIENGVIYSTPELAAKRFLELNSESGNEK